MPSERFVGCTLGCLAGGTFEPNAAMLCLLSCYLVEIHSGDDSDGSDTSGDTAGGNGRESDGRGSDSTGPPGPAS
ncbi:MAG: hypothetical protein QXG03_12040 [Halalkalicoccus sp.]